MIRQQKFNKLLYDMKDQILKQIKNLLFAYCVTKRQNRQLLTATSYTQFISGNMVNKNIPLCHPMEGRTAFADILCCFKLFLKTNFCENYW